MQRIVTVSLAPAAAAANNIALAQALGGAGNLILNGAAVAGGVATLDIPRRVYLHSVADDHLRTWTVTGTDRQKRPLVEKLTAAAAGLDVITVNDFLTITQIALDGATAGNVTAGTGAKVSSQWVPVDRYSSMDLGIGVRAPATTTWSIEYAMQDPFTPGVGVQPNSGPPAVILQPYAGPAGLTGQTGNQAGAISTPITAIRLTVTAYGAGDVAFADFAPGFMEAE